MNSTPSLLHSPSDEFNVAQAIYEAVDSLRSLKGKNGIPQNKIIDVYLDTNINDIAYYVFTIHSEAEHLWRVLNGMAKVNLILKIEDKYYELKKDGN